MTADLEQVRDGTLSYDYDPANPCPTQGGANLRMGPLDGGPFDQRKRMCVKPTCLRCVLVNSYPPLALGWA